MKAILMLADGKSFTGQAMGATGERSGEVIFNTAVVGYQEMLTDPANAGKILVLTYPLIGNYGCAPKFNESKRVWPVGLVIKEKTRIFSNWQAKQSFDDFAKEHKLLVIYGIDTRSLAVHLRQKGALSGIISTENFEGKEILSKIATAGKNKSKSYLAEISVSRPFVSGKGKTKIAVLDLGVTRSILRQLETSGFSALLLPYHSSAQDILRRKPKGLIISNGPEEDPGLEQVAENIKGLIGRLPILGISTGHQVLARSLGAKVTRLPMAHRGVNYPILSPSSYKGEITVQNHGFCVDTDSLSKIKAVKVTAYNLNDRSIEEMESKKLRLLGVQYYPQSPGFSEVNNAFRRFAKMLGRSN